MARDKVAFENSGRVQANKIEAMTFQQLLPLKTDESAQTSGSLASPAVRFDALKPIKLPYRDGIENARQPALRQSSAAVLN